MSKWVTTPYNTKTSPKYFQQLKDKAAQIAKEESQAMAQSMVYILRHRQNLKGGSGQSPKWDPSPASIPESKASYLNWKVQDRVNGEYWITNISKAKNGYNYIIPLITGKGWSTKVLTGTWSRLVRGYDGGVYSSQLPNGLAPWKNIKRKELADNIISRMIKEL